MIVLSPIASLHGGLAAVDPELLEIKDGVATLCGGPFDGCPIDDDSEED